RDYLASPAAGKPQGFCYLGPVFRHRGDAPGEFLQAGVESFGRLDTPAADAEMLALGLEATAHYGLAAPDVRMGDIGLFSALAAAGHPRAHRKIPRCDRRPRTRRERTALARPRRKDQARRRPRPARSANRLLCRAWRQGRKHSIFHRLWPRARLLLGLRIRVARRCVPAEWPTRRRRAVRRVAHAPRQHEAHPGGWLRRLDRSTVSLADAA